MSSQQLTFDFPLPQNFSIQDFVQDESNSDALRWVMKWPKWPDNRLIIYGNSKCGKTHLANLWINSVCGYKLTISDLKFPVRDIFQKNVNFLLDSVIYFINPNTESWFFDFLNISIEKNASILITSKRIDFQNLIKLKDLSSRLLSINSIKIEAPNDDLLRKIILKLCNDLCIIVKDDVVNYIINHTNRDMGSIENLIDDLNKISLAQKKNITIPLIKTLLH